MADKEESKVSEEEERQEIPLVDQFLFEGIRRCNAAAVQLSLRKGANVNCVRKHWGDDSHDDGLLEIASREGDTPLTIAIFCKQAEIVRILLDRGANIHATKKHDRKTTLMLACERGNLDIVRMLLAAGVDVDARDERQRTALYYAGIDDEPIQIVRELILEHNANMFITDKFGDRPFDTGYDIDTVNFLLERFGYTLTQEHNCLALHAILNATEYTFAEFSWFHPPMYPFEFCVPLGRLRLEEFRTLLHYFDTELIRNRDDSGKLPIHLACQVNAPVEVLSTLVEMDPATLHMADHTGALPIHLLCGSGATEYASIRYLVEQGGVGTLTARDRQGALPLHHLCGSTNPSWRTVQYLIQSIPGSVEAHTNTGLYPFRIAAGKSPAASLSVLFEIAKANPGLVVPS